MIERIWIYLYNNLRASQSARAESTIYLCGKYSRTSGCDQLSYATTSFERPVFQNTKSFQVKSLYLEPLVSDRDHY